MNRAYAGLGAGIILVSAGCTGHANRADQRTAQLNDHASANNHHAGQIANTRLHHARLAVAFSSVVLVRKLTAVQALPEAVAGVCGPAKRSRSIT